MDGTGGGGLLEARVYRCGAVGEPAKNVRADAARTAIVEAVPLALRGGRRFGTCDVAGDERKFAATSDRERGDSGTSRAVWEVGDVKGDTANYGEILLPANSLCRGWRKC